MADELSKVGLGCGEGGLVAGASCEVDKWLRAGYPRIALAKAKGIPYLPYFFNISGTFDDPSVTSVPMQGADVKKLSQDVIVEGIEVSVVIGRPPANIFQTLSDFFFQYQSGIEATLDLQGSPRPTLAPNFTPIRSLGEVVNSRYPDGWVITPEQGVVMAFNATIALPEFPVRVICTFRCKSPVNDYFVNMSSLKAIEQLRACGVQVPDGYQPCCK